MQALELIDRSPMQAVVATIRGGLEPGQVGGVLARAGVGKSTFLVHVALNSLVRGTDVLHVSLTDTQAHVRSYYDEIFQAILHKRKLEDVWRVRLDVERNRRIHSYVGNTFSLERLPDLCNLTRFHVVRRGDQRVASILPTTVTTTPMKVGTWFPVITR